MRNDQYGLYGRKMLWADWLLLAVLGAGAWGAAIGLGYGAKLLFDFAMARGCS